MKLRPKGKIDETMNFLEAVHPDGLWALSAIKLPSGLTGRVFRPEEREQARGWLEAHDGVQNLYFGVNRVRATFSGGKASKEDVEAALYLQVDIDHLDGLKRLAAYRSQPSIIVFSGGGYQAFWKLAEPTADLDRVERVNRQIAAELGGDSCHNIDRIMRLPGTINLPNAKKRAAGREPTLAYVVEMSMTTYRLDQFAEFVEGEVLPPKGGGGIEMPDASSVVSVNLDALPTAVSADVRKLIEFGDDPDRPIGSADARFPSRSEPVFAVACGLARAGCDAATIAGVLINPAYGISASILEKRGPKKYALKQATAALAAAASGWPDTNAARQPRPTFRNTLVALQRLDIQMRYDLFRRRKMVDGHALEAFEGEVSDDTCMVIRRLIIDDFGFDPGNDHVRDAVHALSLERAYHPVRDMLNGLAWDGVSRLDDVLVNYFGADDTPLNRAIGTITLIAAVRRVRHPGTKFDQILVLEGAQGTGKSTALTILAGSENHSDQDILALDAKGQMEMLEGVWLYELGELEGLGRADIAKVKAFASRTADRGRMAYGRFRENRPREAIFIGTTNDSQYLSDQTGNRRFWPVKTGVIDLEALARDRDQIWAEAAHRENMGESIGLNKDLWADASVEQAARTGRDPWLDILERERGEEGNGDIVRVSSKRLLSEVLRIDTPHQKPSDAKRVAAIMKQLGWDGPKNVRIGGEVMRGYEMAQPEGWRVKQKLY